MNPVFRFFTARFIPVMAAFFFLLLAGPGCLSSFAHTKDESIYLSGSWVKDEVGWRFYSQWNSTYPSGKWAEYQGNSYYFMDNGYMATGWLSLNGHWYYFNPTKGKEEGAMMTGWIQSPGYDGVFYTNQIGIMVTGWHKIDGYWYYFNQNTEGVAGMMAVSKMIDDSYVDSSGRMNESR